MNTFLYGAFGSLLPSILIALSKNFSAPLLIFNSWQHCVGLIIWAVVGGIIARIYPWRMTPDPRWNAVVVGVILPTIISGLLSVGDRASHPLDASLAPRGPVPEDSSAPPTRQQGTLLDLLTLY
ncbi:hypothetical protein [Serratia plymuthica]|uniref:hypothetical protein n=1 Tax=Serratia plymuthica TaxID=82996 RepID=UPI00148B7AA3|nr:hypothetical protein [Serratia plymuthica]